MRQGIRILGTILLAVAVSSPAWAKNGGNEPQKGGLPALEDRVEADEGQNNFATATETATTCTLVNSSSSAGPVTANFVANGECEVTFSKDVSACSAVATIVGNTAGDIAVTSTTKTITGDSWDVFTFPAGTEGAANFNLTVTCP